MTRLVRSISLFSLCVTVAASAQAQLAARIAAPISNASRVTLTDSRSPLARPSADLGAVDPNMKLPGISIIFSRTAAQQSELDALVAAQQDPASPLYHHWLTPDQFAARFGLADSDIAAVSSWLQHQGFAIDSVARSRNRISFSGTAALVASAFGTTLHYYHSSGATQHFAPSSDFTIPAALASSVQAITNLSSFRPHSHIKVSKTRPSFTSGTSGNHFISPGDIATIYDITPAYSAGFDGTNQSIAILGQSAVTLSDITLFQAAAGVTAKTPDPVLVPSSGISTIYADGDEAESDLDLEYSSTIAKGAQVYFVYTGSTSTYGVFDSLRYAVEERIAPIVSISYGDCETDFGIANYNMFNAYLEQGAAQGQSILSAAGDDGSTDCMGIDDPTDPLTTAQMQALAVDFPGDSQYVTALGGTEFPAADVLAGNNTYFAPQGTSDVVSSALSYIPEMAWNDDAANAVGATAGTDPLASGGGGVSVFTPRPSWQTGSVGGVAIPSGTFRLMPDISFDASPVNAPLVYCSSDTSFWSQGQVASCNDGFRDGSSGALTIAGGTSFDAPIFAGMLAIINQSLNSTGQGVINPTLYTLASNSATYSSVFHDITAGGNQCDAGTTFCSTAGASEYPAIAGYDEATGLGSADFYKLLTAWPQPAVAALAATTTTLTPASGAPAASATDVITITVAQTSQLAPALGIPSGTVTLIIDGAAPATTLTLVNGSASYTFSSPTTGAHVLVATYSGDTLFAPSSSTLVLNIAPVTVGSFTLSATNVTVPLGGSGTSTATITPTGAYTGTDVFGITSTSTALADLCITGNSSATVTSITPVTTVFTLYTNLDTCNSLANSNLKPHQRFYRIRSTGQHASNTPNSPLRRLPLPIALAGTLLLFGFNRRFGKKNQLRRNLLRAGLSLAVLVTLSAAGLGLTACSSSASSTTTLNDVPAGTYVLTLTATDQTTAQTASANFNLVVQ